MAVKEEPPVRVVVVDVLKPHKPNIVEFGKLICKEKTVETANVSVYAMDEKTESIKVTLEGKNINFDAVEKIIEENGGVVHSVDKTVIGRKEIIQVPQTIETMK